MATTTTTQHTGVAQRKRAVKTRLLHFDLRGSDLRMVMDHTPEDVGSKPTTGNIHFAGFTEAGRHSQATSKHGTQSNNQQPIPLWRSGKRAGLITPRTLDRNESAVTSTSPTLQKPPRRNKRHTPPTYSAVGAGATISSRQETVNDGFQTGSRPAG